MIYKLTGSLQNYVWGGHQYIPELLNIPADELPYLLKILEIGFAEENAKGIDLKASTRTYKDNNHKPEMMIALSDFWLLHGFKNKSDIIEACKKIAGTRFT